MVVNEIYYIYKVMVNVKNVVQTQIIKISLSKGLIEIGVLSKTINTKSVVKMINKYFDEKDITTIINELTN